MNKDFKTKRIVNPLEPNYQWPSGPAAEWGLGPKFLRDNLQTEDINLKKKCRT